MNIGNIAMGTGFLLILIGLWGILTRTHIIQIIVSFSVVDTGVHLIMVAAGYMHLRTAPILSEGLSASDAPSLVVDPLPQALVLTAIVIGLGVTALMLAFALRIHEKNDTLEIKNIERLRW